jgi:hypothetical protein
MGRGFISPPFSLPSAIIGDIFLCIKDAFHFTTLALDLHADPNATTFNQCNDDVTVAIGMLIEELKRLLFLGIGKYLIDFHRWTPWIN